MCIKQQQTYHLVQTFKNATKYGSGVLQQMHTMLATIEELISENPPVQLGQWDEWKGNPKYHAETLKQILALS
jgi:hypothetical protein